MDDQKTAQQLANDALGAIGTEMMEKTGGDRWRAGQPLLTEPEQQSLPATEAEAEPTPVDGGETTDAGTKPTSEPGEKLILGKWKSEEEALRGYHEAVHMGNAAKAERDSLAARLAAVERTIAPVSRPEMDPFDELEAFGLPKEVTERAVKHLTQKAVQEMFAPTFHQIQADKDIIQKYPEYKDRFNDLSAFVETNADVKDSVQRAEAVGEYGLAREYAWLKFVNSGVQQIESDLKAADASRSAEIRATRKDAAVQAAPRTDTRTKPSEDTGITSERLEYLKGLAKAGHPTPLWRETIGRTLPKDFDSLLGG